jgi:hypothetical protein
MEQLRDNFAQIAAYAVANYKCRKGEEVKYLCGAYARSITLGAQSITCFLKKYKCLGANLSGH